MDVRQCHELLRAEFERIADRLWDVALGLHGDPETAFSEHRAADRLCSHLAEAGFDVERSVAGMPTAFVGRSANGQGPTVALLLEYDALPGLGHACGHNLIAAAGLGAALAVHRVLGDVPGTVLAVGTPAEEGGGGKIIELTAGVFEGVDAALMFHPGAHSWMWAPLTAQVELRVTFRGQAAHPTGNPTEGVDALARSSRCSPRSRCCDRDCQPARTCRASSPTVARPPTSCRTGLKGALACAASP